MNEFFSWSFLGTFAGAVLGTGLVTQFIKGIGFLAKIPTQLVSYVIALVILLAATAFTGGATAPGDWAIAVLNAALVSLSSNGAYTAVSRKSGE